MKYICDKCGHVFDEDEAGVIYETVGEGVMRGPYPAENCCPECGSTDFYEAQECAECGEWFFEDEMIETDNFWYCRECAKNIRDLFNEKWEKIKAC